MHVLGIETSCDDTTAAVVDGEGVILSNVVHSQLAHATHGGVVPEVAARAHLQLLPKVIELALQQANLTLNDMDAIASTTGPGLIGGVIVGTVMGKAMAASLNKPWLSINHLEGHALSPRLSHKVPFPYLLLLVSGGHTQLLIVHAVGQYQQLGSTRDDAAGECFDKIARSIGLGFPGGAALSKLAESGDATRFDLPRPLLGSDGCDFSFSGLKTAAARLARQIEPEAYPHLCAGLEAVMADVMADRCRNALRIYLATKPATPTLVVAGGVAANKVIRQRLTDICKTLNVNFAAPPAELCTDNAAMIAWAGVERLQHGLHSNFDVAPRPRWPLEEVTL